jgi:hypothetical protein
MVGGASPVVFREIASPRTERCKALVEIDIALRCRDFPPDTPLRLGIQRGKTAVIEDVPAVGPEKIVFSFPVTVRPGAGGVDFGGPFVQGRPGGRFVYLCWGWGTRDDAGEWQGVRRAKIPLSGITAPLVEAATRHGAAIAADLDMTDHRGLPVCASYPAERVEWKRTADTRV